ncbi:organic hydroperoxide resistance protein [Rhizobium leguminosarum]|uniref:organic hydroperoxide resistance protein n=1 Tax=Rhizobium leguminosarum TaxID=384 RepID=UPI00143F6DDC|nr:organic hydroperoxide resistance protein [Rhizobium leguminosarum]NKL21801.1 Ohr family peroxiredoxin [Rhizobium leguminosarum bv. viciae]
MTVNALYKTSATAQGGGRDGHTALADGTLEFDLVIPKELGGPGGDGANPEKLFALGYSACFLGALRVGAQQLKTKVPEGSTVSATIGMGPRSEGGFGITAALDVYLPGMAEADARHLVEATHSVCPYSNSIKATVDVAFTIRT